MNYLECFYLKISTISNYPKTCRFTVLYLYFEGVVGSSDCDGNLLLIWVRVGQGFLPGGRRVFFLFVLFLLSFSCRPSLYFLCSLLWELVRHDFTCRKICMYTFFHRGKRTPFHCLILSVTTHSTVCNRNASLYHSKCCKYIDIGTFYNYAKGYMKIEFWWPPFLFEMDISPNIPPQPNQDSKIVINHCLRPLSYMLKSLQNENTKRSLRRCVKLMCLLHVLRKRDTYNKANLNLVHYDLTMIADVNSS